MTPPILLFGATSLSGFNLARLFPQRIQPFVPPNSKNPWPALNLEDPAWLKALFSAQKPQLLIYCHAVCDVGKCENAPDWAYEINVGHIHRLLATLPDTVRLVYVSSDHVFGGNGAYDEKATPCPISVYGKTRVEAENLVLKRDHSLVLRAEVGLDVERVKVDMRDPGITAVIEQDLADAKALGVRKTPGFFVNGKPLEPFGARPLADLIKAEIRAHYPE